LLIVQVFPQLLKKLLEKDFGPAARSGFEATGLYPLSVERAISKLPKQMDDRQAETAVQRELLKTLNDMRFNAPATKHAQRPKKNQKLPAGASYTCRGDQEQERTEEEDVDIAQTSDSDTSNDSSSEDEERRRRVSSIVKRLGKRKNLGASSEEEVGNSSDSSEEADDYEDEAAEEVLAAAEEEVEQREEEPETEEDSPSVDFPHECFVVVVYQKDWYVGQVLDKKGEAEAEQEDNYILVSFMERVQGDHLKWPKRLDLLNVLKDDVLFVCEPPTPGASTSSSRVNSFVLTKEDLKKAKQMFLETQDYYLTKIFSARLLLLVYQVPVLCVKVCA
jgi:hypothetical protein